MMYIAHSYQLHDNTMIYQDLMLMLMLHKAEANSYGILFELVNSSTEFKPAGIINGSSKKYIDAEEAWYKSMDLCIKDHPVIAENPIWKSCATADGMVNSNYGWCVYSKENGCQFDHALSSLWRDKNSKQAVIIYTRPDIHVEMSDGVHANKDMMCTCYVDYLIRNNELNAIVHMRSNDIWYGLRYDLYWQMQVLENMHERLKDRYEGLKLGTIYWNCDSLHMYESSFPKAFKWLVKSIDLKVFSPVDINVIANKYKDLLRDSIKDYYDELEPAKQVLVYNAMI